MSFKERVLLRETLLASVCILGAYFFLVIASGLFLGKEFKDYIFQWPYEIEYNKLEPEQLEIRFDNGGILQVEDISKEDGWLTMTLVPEKAGEEYMTILNAETKEELLFTPYYVSPTGSITNRITANFTHYRLYHLYLVLMNTAFAVLLWIAFGRAQKKLRYSYQAIFYSGLAIWLSILAITLWAGWFKGQMMTYTYSMIQGMAGNMIVITFLPLLVFCLALSTSNISLIRHEGFRTRNALGIILSLVMLGGTVLFAVFYAHNFMGSATQMRMYNAFTGIYNSIYAFLECFLIGAIICGTLSARHEPEYDMDYLIILGCKVRPDGGLYPLIRGRVDRAIAFYKKQLEKTGKKAVFVPSGGKGSDETISEAEAMKRYLLEQGIPEEQILVENQSKNTKENMQFSKKLIDERTTDAKAAFSTTNFHVFRSGIIARQNGFEPDGMGSNTKWYFWPNAYIREVIGMMSYKWKAMLAVMIPIVVFLFASEFLLYTL